MPPIFQIKFSSCLDAMLGVVTIEQNNVIKIFSGIAAVAADAAKRSLRRSYGMNLISSHMPEASTGTLGVSNRHRADCWLASALPYFFFRWKGKNGFEGRNEASPRRGRSRQGPFAPQDVPDLH